MIRLAEAADVGVMIGRIREADRREAAAASGREAEDAAARGLSLSPYRKAFVHDGRVEAVFGVIPVSQGRGYPWLIGTDALFSTARVRFARESRAEVEAMNRAYPRLAGFVHAANTAHVRWLAWCGFTLSPPEPRGVAGELFLPFERTHRPCAIPP